jgi:hypothetical protein
LESRLISRSNISRVSIFNISGFRFMDIVIII